MLVRLVVITCVAAALLAPAPTEAQEGPNPAETERKLNEVRAQKGQIDLEVNGLAAQDAEVQAALTALQTNVSNQQAELDEAERAADAADAEVVTAIAAVDAKQGEIDDLNAAADALVVEAYVNPPSDNALDAFKADSLSDASVKQALVDIQADSDADVLDQLEQAHEDLEVEKANKETLAAEAEAKRADAEAELTELQNALTQQEEFAARGRGTAQCHARRGRIAQVVRRRAVQAADRGADGDRQLARRRPGRGRGQAEGRGRGGRGRCGGGQPARPVVRRRW